MEIEGAANICFRTLTGGPAELLSGVGWLEEEIDHTYDLLPLFVGALANPQGVGTHRVFCGNKVVANQRYRWHDDKEELIFQGVNVRSTVRFNQHSR